MEVLRVSPAETYPWLLGVHYARRIPNIMFAFGLFDGREPLGYVTYGCPSSAPLRSGVAGDENASAVIELNRLVFAKGVTNGPSMLVGRSMQMLPKPAIVVSFADCAQGHIGYVYQACNFIYTGLSAKRTDWKLRGQEGLHGQSIADMSRSAAGGERGSRAAFMREKFGEDFYLEDRPRKHRYIYVCGSRTQRKRIAKAIRYPTEAYPKGDTSRYEVSTPECVQPQLFSVG